MARNMNGAKSAGTKRKGKGGSLRDKASNDLQKQKGMELTNEISEENGCNGEIVAHKRPKRAAACSNFKEKMVKLSDKSSYVEVNKNRVEEDEMVAVDLTKLGPEDLPPCRKLMDFIVHDSEGNPQPFEMSEIDDCFITSLIMPMDDDLEKDKDRGIKCEGFGRIENWSISGYDEGSPIIWLSTEIADYECVKPAGSYKKFYDLFHVKAQICVEVYRKLARCAGGNPDTSLDELLAGVIRSSSWNKKFSDGLTSRDFVISLGDFIYNQLIGLDESSENNDVHFATLPTLLALREECHNRVQSSRLPPATSNGSLKINEGGISNAVEDEDEKLARLLQEEEDWKLLRQRNGRRGSAASKNFYVKISEAEIANDYPLPAYYKPAVQEMDEYIFSEADFGMSYLELPRRILNNWALYNSDSRLISLELIPMKPCAEVDVTVFGSGLMREDDGSGYFQDAEPNQSSSSTSSSIDEGVPIYLSSIKEWMIEFGSSMIFISIRTDVAWYRLEKPTKQYAPWYETILKIARLAVAIITLLKEQSRVSRLSFTDVIKKVSEFDKGHPAYISSNLELVERYIVVHGQIILQQFSEYPDDMIQKSAFITGLSEKMEQRCHTKLAMKKKVVVQKEANLNPSATMRPILSKRKAMRATTTKLVNKIWGDYYSNFFPEDTKDGDGLESKELEEEQEENDEEDVDDEDLTFQEEKASKQHSLNISHRSRSDCEGITWEDEPTGKMDSGESLHASAFAHGHSITVGGGVSIAADDSEEEPTILLVEYLFEQNVATKMVHGRILKRGNQTVLGNAADERELFLTHDCLEIELGDVRDAVTIDIRSRSWGHSYRKEYANADKIDRARAEERKKKGLPMEYYCKSLYWPEKGGFFTLPYDSLGLGSGTCSSCKHKALQGDNFSLTSSTSFVFKNKEYNVNDFLYIKPQFLNEEKEEDRGTFKAGRNVGLKPYIICQLLDIQHCAASKQATPKSTKLKVRRYYRPDDISATKAYNSDIREIYYSEEIFTVPPEMIEGKCEIQKKCDILDLGLPVVIDHVFFCEYCYDPIKGSLNQLPANVKLVPLKRKGVSPGATKKKGKGKCDEQKQDKSDEHVLRENRLATLDIFAGCGGLSEGLQQSGVSYTKWAIEYEEPAGEAFRHNHPESIVFVDNCNVILRAIMEKCGDLDDCISTSEAAEMATALNEEKIKNLPIPGEVDFINGGPPCQGFSGMNRFNHGTWSKVQCEMILAFLSFAEYFRPKFFLLENVRNFVSFNKGQTFRLTLASLLAMGYQVRFGILEAGAFGVSQSRKRAFIWAASPEEILPEWPEPMHVFAGSELRICLPGDPHYAAVRSTSGGAPFRSITVRDTIGDLPPVKNGASNPTIDYGSDPVSWFQKQIRGNMSVLNDHISKEMNELNLIRCQHIPKLPGADWRDLPDEKVKLSTGQMVDMVPWCLPNTAKRHNQWKGLYGRLDWEGNFPTSITDPQPMGKVGMCFHPEQDRILTVRECARSQGFPDGYIFSGNIQNKHRQIGNAVPPPLAYALGRKLKESVQAKSSSA